MGTQLTFQVRSLLDLRERHPPAHRRPLSRVSHKDFGEDSDSRYHMFFAPLRTAGSRESVREPE